MSAATWLGLSGCLLLTAAAVAGVILLLIAGARRERRRRDQLAQWAQRHGWRYTPSPAVVWGRRLPGGNPHGVSVAVSATIGGYPVSVGEYSYTETHTSSVPDGAGGSTTATTSHSHHVIVAAVWLSRPHPAIAVQPRGSVSRIGRSILGDRATAMGDEQFDRRFRVAGADPGHVRQLIGPALTAAHLAGVVPPWSLHGHELLAYWPGQLTDPDQIPALAASLIRVADLLGR